MSKSLPKRVAIPPQPYDESLRVLLDAVNKELFRLDSGIYNNALAVSAEPETETVVTNNSAFIDLSTAVYVDSKPLGSANSWFLELINAAYLTTIPVSEDSDWVNIDNSIIKDTRPKNTVLSTFLDLEDATYLDGTT